ncbi:putative reverse transcriptase domain-containing protein [Tanacetum coccineum]
MPLSPTRASTPPPPPSRRCLYHDPPRVRGFYIYTARVRSVCDDGTKKSVRPRFQRKLGCSLPLVEFSYNNSYHSSVRCAPFEALYGRKCRSPIMWAEVGEGKLIGPELVYDDKRRKPLEFSVGDYVLLKVSPWKGVVHFGKKGKLAPRFVGPFEIIEKIGPVAYSQVEAKLNFMEELVEILEREFKKLKRSRIAIVKVRWNSKRGPEFTWELKIR